MPEYSLVIPVFNEEESLPALWQEVGAVMGKLGKPYEVIFVDDGSSDRSGAILKSFADAAPEAVRVITQPARLGQTRALRTGLDAVRGEIAVTLDADLQNDPADIPQLIEKLNEGYDVVCGWRRARQDTPLKAGLSKLGNVLQRAFTGLNIHDVSCTLRAYRRECLPAVTLKEEGQHRFIPLSLALQGYRAGEIESRHRIRRYGVTKYSHKRIFKVMADFFRILKSQGKG